MLSGLVQKMIKFGVVGISGVFVDFSTTWICKEWAKLNKYFSNAAGFLMAVVSNFFLNYLWTFRGIRVNALDAFWAFLIIALVGLFINSFLVYVFHTSIKINFYLSKAFAILLVFGWNFGANYFFNFHSATK